MYKHFFKKSKVSIAFNTFPKSAKKTGLTGKYDKVYQTGIRNWDSENHKTYSLVLGRFRIMIYVNKPGGDCTN